MNANTFHLMYVASKFNKSIGSLPNATDFSTYKIISYYLQIVHKTYFFSVVMLSMIKPKRLANQYKKED